MPVDMFERRFRQELEKLPAFVPDDNRDPKAWAADFPAWRALFTSLCYWGHSTGYRLPSLERFIHACRRAYTHFHPQKERFTHYFEDETLYPGVEQRLKYWYESGMAETYLYVCLVEALEDNNRNGVVLYDARVDWKLKTDLLVLLKGKPFRIDAFFGSVGERASVTERREQIERVRKMNTAVSSHWNNSELEAITTFQVTRSEMDHQSVNGLRLFSIASVNALLSTLYEETGVEKGFLFTESSL